MDKIMKDIEDDLKGFKEVTNLLTSVGSGDSKAVNEGDIYVRLAGIKERRKTQKEIMGEARAMLKGFPALRTAVQDVGGAGGGSESAFQFRMTGINLEKLKVYADKMMKAMRAKKGFVDVDTTFELGKPEVRVVIDRQKAADLGVRVGDIANALQLYVSGEKDITKYKVEDELYEVRVRLKEEFRGRPADILGLTIPASMDKNGEKRVRLDQVARISETTGPSQIERFMRQRSIEVNANLTDELAMGDAKQFIVKEAEDIFDEPGYKVNFVGQAKYLKEMQASFLTAFLMSFIFMYMILASLFESWLHPVTILLSLPLAFPFAILSLFATASTLHIISILGLFLLIGIVKKNSILQVDYTNTLRAAGLERHEALVQASRTRLRPIMMTTLTLVASMVPVALSSGPGSSGRSPMAIVIIGGQSLCLLVTLLLTPVFYSVFDDAQVTWFPKWRERIAVTSNRLFLPLYSRSERLLRAVREKLRGCW
jgi:HAE1 family hydrophobic/amphiphilic exporter-1